MTCLNTIKFWLKRWGHFKRKDRELYFHLVQKVHINGEIAAAKNKNRDLIMLSAANFFMILILDANHFEVIKD